MSIHNELAALVASVISVAALGLFGHWLARRRYFWRLCELQLNIERLRLRLGYELLPAVRMMNDAMQSFVDTCCKVALLHSRGEKDEPT
jgi:hypothetical protein